jgi:hypothetical protein
VANNEIVNNKKCRHIAGNFDGHADAGVQCGMHCPMDHIPGLLEVTATIGQVPALHCPGGHQGHQFWLQTQITIKTQLFASNRTVAQAKS